MFHTVHSVARLNDNRETSLRHCTTAKQNATFTDRPANSGRTLTIQLVPHIGHAHMGNSFHSGFFVDSSSNWSHQQCITVCFEKKSPQSALIGHSSLIMHDNWKI